VAAEDTNKYAPDAESDEGAHPVLPMIKNVVIPTLQNLSDRVGRMEETVTRMYEDGVFVRKREFEARFEPIKLIVYGLIGLILMGVGGALMSMVVKR
jgi:hypothetical protein